MKRGSYIWIAWITGTVSSFAVLETISLRYGHFPPLTYVLRYLLGIHPRTCYGRFALAAFAAVWVWLCSHLARVVVNEVETPGVRVDNQARVGVDFT